MTGPVSRLVPGWLALPAWLRRSDAAAAESGELGGAGRSAGFTPGGVGLGARMLVTEAGCVAVFAVTGYPAQVHPGWLDPLLGYPGRVDVSVHIDPVDPLTAADRLRKQLARLEAGRRHTAEHNKLPDPLVEATGGTHRVAFRAHASTTEDRLIRTDPAFLASLPDSDDAGTVYLTDPDTDTGGTDSDRRRPVHQRAIEEHQRRRRGGS